MSAGYFYPHPIMKWSRLLPLHDISRSSPLWKTSLCCQVKDIAEGNQQTLNNTHCLASYLEMLLCLWHLPAFLLWTRIKVTGQERMVSIQATCSCKQGGDWKRLPCGIIVHEPKWWVQQSVWYNTTLAKSALAELCGRTSRYLTRKQNCDPYDLEMQCYSLSWQS